MPPSHCVMARQKKKPRPGVSKSVRMVAPVAVIPDIASNSASMGSRPTHRCGTAQSSASISQTPETTASASIRRRPAPAPRDPRIIASPMAADSRPPIRKPGTSFHSP